MHRRGKYGIEIKVSTRRSGPSPLQLVMWAGLVLVRIAFFSFRGCFKRRDIRRMNPTDIIEPAKAAMISAAEDTAPSLLKKKIMVTATTIFAPEEMPSTKGPAMGFPKKFCSRKPDSDSAPPNIAAMKMRGMRIFQMMEYWVDSCPCPERMCNSSLNGICTLPITMFNTVMPSSAAISSANTSV